jgi:hypothetical protein
VAALSRWLLLCGATVTVTGAALLVAGDVIARGPDVGSPYELLLPGFSHGFSTPPRRSRSHDALAEGARVCVRLCDGGYFPIAANTGYPSEEAACQSLCPDAPTAVYREMNSSDRIDDAVSATGESYSALPTAFSYREKVDATCACHRLAASANSFDQDPTLRKGDYVMTSSGLRVFEGQGTLPHQASDFVAIAGASIPSYDRDVLSAMDRRQREP